MDRIKKKKRIRMSSKEKMALVIMAVFSVVGVVFIVGAVNHSRLFA